MPGSQYFSIVRSCVTWMDDLSSLLSSALPKGGVQRGALLSDVRCSTPRFKQHKSPDLQLGWFDMNTETENEWKMNPEREKENSVGMHNLYIFNLIVVHNICPTLLVMKKCWITSGRIRSWIPKTSWPNQKAPKDNESYGWFKIAIGALEYIYI